MHKVITEKIFYFFCKQDNAKKGERKKFAKKPANIFLKLPE